MRAVPAAMARAWRSGDFTGDQRPIARATIQHGNTRIADLGYNVYASSIFGSNDIPRELPNVKSVSWSRGVDTDYASCTIVCYNTKPLPIGQPPTRDLDLPGYYTPNRGKNSFANQWGQTPNEWSELLVPDNIIRTFEGFGCQPQVIPEKDPHLMQTGVWRIDTVQYETSGLITITCRDIGSILGDQIVFPPVVPQRFYPLVFGRSPTVPGFVGPKAYTYVVDQAGKHDPAHPPPPGWDGPLNEPQNVAATSGDKSITVSWQPPARPSSLPASRNLATYLGKSYAVVGYQLVLDDQVLPQIYSATPSRGGGTYTAMNAKLDPQALYNNWSSEPTMHAGIPSNLITNGQIYSVTVVAIWQEIDRYIVASPGQLIDWNNPTYDTKYRTAISDQGTVALISPAAINGPEVTDIALNVNEVDELAPGKIRINTNLHGHPSATWVMLAYRTDPTTKRLVQKRWTIDSSASIVIFTVGTGADDLTAWNWFTYGIAYDARVSWGGPMYGHPDPIPIIGHGRSMYRSDGYGGEYWQPPKIGVPPHAPPANTGPTLRIGNVVKALNAQQVQMRFDDSSNTYYDGWGAPELGHYPSDAFDGNDATFFLSISNERNDQGYSYEWIQGSVPNVTLTSIKFRTKLAGYFIWVSVFAKGRWVQYHPGDVIPYDEHNPFSHNGGDIPFVTTTSVPDENWHEVVLPSPIPGATKVRITLHNLQNFGLPGFPYRAGVRSFVAYALPANPDTLTSPFDDDSPQIVRSYQVYEPAHIQPGAGEYPGTYNDYTDIIKLFCAWGGFFWPEGATQRLSDGTYLGFDFGIGPYGLENVDPVLGVGGSGRVWGDFMQTGTNGPAAYDVSNWDKKSLTDAIKVIKDVIGFYFWIDETGGAVWRLPNTFSLGNWISDYSGDAIRISNVITIDEHQTLIGLRATLSGTNVREAIFVANSAGTFGATSKPFNSNPTGLRRVGGWTDYNFQTQVECQMTADLISLNALFTYRVDTVTIVGYPAIQVDDQVRIIEQTTGEAYYHYVRGIQSSLDHETGQYTYTLDTNWLGERPFDLWAFDPGTLSAATQDFLAALQKPAGAALATVAPDGSSTSVAVTSYPGVQQPILIAGTDEARHPNDWGAVLP